MPHIIPGLVSVHTRVGPQVPVLRGKGFSIGTTYIVSGHAGARAVKANPTDSGRYTVFLDKDDSHDTAQLIAEAINHLIVLYDANGLIPFPFVPVHVPIEIINDNAVSIESIIKNIYVFGASEDDKVEMSARFISGASFSVSVMNKAFSALSGVLTEPQIGHALAMYKKFKSEGYLDSYAAMPVLIHPERRPKTCEEQARLESALLHAYKSIEALVGEPGKDRERLRKRMSGWGIAADLVIPNRDERKTVLEQLYELRDVRDKKAGHGHKAGAAIPLTYYDVLKAQRLARTVIERAIAFKNNVA